jgi:hypothetical protein
MASAAVRVGRISGGDGAERKRLKLVVPTLAKNATVGQPPWEWCNAKMGHPPLDD